FNMADEMMSGEDSENQVVLTRGKIITLLIKQFEKLPERDRNAILHGPFYLGSYAAFTGVLANTLYRKALHVTRAPFASNLPMGFIPFASVALVYNIAITNPLMTGDLNCSNCVIVRGALTSFFIGGIYPILLALPCSAGLAARYNSAPQPERGNIIRHWVNITKPIVMKMRPVLLLHVIYGSLLALWNFKIYEKMVKSITEEEVLSAIE
ncbi:hypothetical protein DNTS_021667, partial [Danionella cerebrum]